MPNEDFSNHPKVPDNEWSSFKKELTCLINKHGIDSDLDLTDFDLADSLILFLRLKNVSLEDILLKNFKSPGPITQDSESNPPPVGKKDLTSNGSSRQFLVGPKTLTDKAKKRCP